MGKVQCPNCNSFDTGSKMNPKTGCGCVSVFLAIMALGGASASSATYGGDVPVIPIIGIPLLIFGIIMLIMGRIQKSKQKTEVYECKGCKCEFNVEF